MSKSNPVKYKFDVVITNDCSIEIPKEMLNDLTNKGMKKVTISVEPNYKEVFDSLNICEDKVKSIISVQELPEEVVADFFRSKSSIADKSFLKRIEAYA